MARYIDADKAMEEVNRIGGHNLCGWSTLGVKALIDRQPAADVVPKSEYNALAEQNESLEIELENKRRNLGDAREGWNDAECEVERLREINSLLTEAMQVKQEWQRRYNNAKAEVAREIFEEIEERIATHAFTSKSEDYSDGAFDTIAWVDSKLAKLKKKYTED